MTERHRKPLTSYQMLNEYYLHKVFRCFYTLSLLQLLSVQFCGAQIHLHAVEVLDSETNSTNFYRVKLLNFVVVFAFGAFEGTYDEPKSVDRLVFCRVISVIDEEASATYFFINNQLVLAVGIYYIRYSA